MQEEESRQLLMASSTTAAVSIILVVIELPQAALSWQHGLLWRADITNFSRPFVRTPEVDTQMCPFTSPIDHGSSAGWRC